MKIKNIHHVCMQMACGYIISHNGLVNVVVKSYLSNSTIYWFLELVDFIVRTKNIKLPQRMYMSGQKRLLLAIWLFAWKDSKI